MIILIISLAGFLGFAAIWTVAYFYRRRQIQQIPAILRNQDSRFELIKDVKLHYVVRGKGPDILLLHGIAANIYTWRHLIPLLSKHARVWAIDIKGFGLSGKPAHPHYDFPSQTDLIAEFLKMKGVKKCTVVGNSMGACIAATIGLHYPDLVQNLVLINSAHDRSLFLLPSSPIRWTAKRLGYTGWLLTPFITKHTVRVFIEQWLYGNRARVADEIVTAYLTPYLESREAYKAFWEAFAHLSCGIHLEKYNELKVKPLILVGKQDRLVPVKYGRRLHKMIPGSILEIHPTAGHHLQEEDPQWLANHILKLVAKDPQWISQTSVE